MFIASEFFESHLFPIYTQIKCTAFDSQMLCTLIDKQKNQQQQQQFKYIKQSNLIKAQLEW